MKLYLIECRTGCSCCSHENHRRGFYASEEDAVKRINFFLDPQANNNPVASRFARKGAYEVVEVDAEEISGARIIIGSRVHDFPGVAVIEGNGQARGEVEIYE